MSIKHNAVLLAVLGIALSLFAVSQASASDRSADKGKITVATYNLYFGADIFRVFEPTPCGVPQAVDGIYRTILENNFPERAEAIANEIRRERPQVIGLQEVAIIRTQFPGNSLAPDGSGIDILGESDDGPLFTFKLDAENVELDFLDILLNALWSRNLDYVPVDLASNTNADVEFPAIEFDGACNPQGLPRDVRLTDRDVILVDSSLLPLNLALEGNFAVNTPIQLPTFLPTQMGPIPAVYVTEYARGWGAVNVNRRGQSFTVLNTHLEVGDRSLPPDQGLNLIQLAQAFESAQVQMLLPKPLLLVGDINSSPASGVTDPRPAYAVYESFGLVDTWDLRIDGPPSAGMTCCQAETLDNAESELYERIDVVLADFGDFAPYNIRSVVMGDKDRAKTASGKWPSDHGGVAVRLKLSR